MELIRNETRRVALLVEYLGLLSGGPVSSAQPPGGWIRKSSPHIRQGVSSPASWLGLGSGQGSGGRIREHPCGFLEPYRLPGHERSRLVQNCHPPKSVATVEEILRSFKRGEKDSAEFWLSKDEAFIHIQYFAVRDGSGDYLRTLEVSQNVAHIRSLEGEKRLLH